MSTIEALSQLCDFQCNYICTCGPGGSPIKERFRSEDEVAQLKPNEAVLNQINLDPGGIAVTARKTTRDQRLHFIRWPCFYLVKFGLISVEDSLLLNQFRYDSNCTSCMHFPRQFPRQSL